MTVFEWKDEKRNNQDGIVIEEGFIKCLDGYVSNVVFRNYPKLEIFDLRLSNCEFVNCGFISVYDGLLMDCKFHNIDTLSSTRSDVVHSTFQNLQCNNEAAIFMEDCQMANCQIRDVELTNDAYLCQGVGDVQIKHCDIRNCVTDRRDRKVFCGIQLKKGFFKSREKECEIVDEFTCTGLDQVKYIGGEMRRELL